MGLRTIKKVPEIFTPEEWVEIKKDHFIHELGRVCNISSDYETTIQLGLEARRNEALQRPTMPRKGGYRRLRFSPGGDPFHGCYRGMVRTLCPGSRPVRADGHQSDPATSPPVRAGLFKKRCKCLGFCTLPYGAPAIIITPLAVLTGICRNESAARFSGINTDGMVIVTYVISALCAGLAGLLFPWI